MRTVNLKIETCRECPHCRETQDYTSDSFESVSRLDCYQLEFTNGKHKDHGRNIQRYVAWNDKDNYIPDWCPLLEENEK